MSLRKPEVSLYPNAVQNGSPAPTFVRPDVPPAAPWAEAAPLDVPTEVLTPVPEPQASHELAVPAAASVPASVPARRPPSTVDDGMDFLDDKIGFGSFPIIKLEQGDFEMGKEVLGSEVEVQVYSARMKYLFRENARNTKNLFYSYDLVDTASGGGTVAQRLAQWKAEGIEWERKDYIEAVVCLTAGPHAGEIALLSIPPASVPRFAGYRKAIAVMQPGETVLSVITKCTKAAKVTLDNGESFYPWDFKFVRKAQKVAA